METNRLTPQNHRIRQEVVLGERVALTHKMEADKNNCTTTLRVEPVILFQVERQQAARQKSQLT